jgi:hypothetical protein
MKPSEYVEMGWTQSASARDAGGKIVPSNHKNAVSWCPIGAFIASYGYGIRFSCHYRKLAVYLEEELHISQSGQPNVLISVWNDSPARTKSEVISALKAIGE